MSVEKSKKDCMLCKVTNEENESLKLKIEKLQRDLEDALRDSKLAQDQLNDTKIDVEERITEIRRAKQKIVALKNFAKLSETMITKLFKFQKISFQRLM